ncbi:hypothetical protein GCM10009798_32270 [Nocardioides panacihumi]|uniref:Uncharacterized protein n=1 Tax=Nocardioides panacihumi TaxID=400774 RepID=A0ABN2RHX1_9ACTN
MAKVRSFRDPSGSARRFTSRPVVAGVAVGEMTLMRDPFDFPLGDESGKPLQQASRTLGSLPSGWWRDQHPSGRPDGHPQI